MRLGITVLFGSIAVYAVVQFAIPQPRDMAFSILSIVLCLVIAFTPVTVWVVGFVRVTRSMRSDLHLAGLSVRNPPDVRSLASYRAWLERESIDGQKARLAYKLR